MNKLLSVLLAAALTTPAFAADAAKPAAPAAPAATKAPAAAAAPAATAAVKSPAVGEAVTPQNNEASMKEIIAKHKQESDAAKAKAAAAKK